MNLINQKQQYNNIGYYRVIWVICIFKHRIPRCQMFSTAWPGNLIRSATFQTCVLGSKRSPDIPKKIVPCTFLLYSCSQTVISHNYSDDISIPISIHFWKKWCKAFSHQSLGLLFATTIYCIKNTRYLASQVTIPVGTRDCFPAQTIY